MDRPKQQKQMRLGFLNLICGFLCGCSSYPGVEFDDSKAHHGDGEFIALAKPSLVKYFFMRLREDGPALLHVRAPCRSGAGRNPLQRRL
jgi:hypothetical protein